MDAEVVIQSVGEIDVVDVLREDVVVPMELTGPAERPHYIRLFDVPEFQLLDDDLMGYNRVPLIAKVESPKVHNSPLVYVDDIETLPVVSNLDGIQSSPQVSNVEKSMLFLDEIVVNDRLDVQLLEFDGLVDNVGEFPDVDRDAAVTNSIVEDPTTKVSVPGLREVPCPVLQAARQGNEKSKSEHNDNWSLRRVDQLRSALKWDMSIPFGDLEFTDIDELLSNLFSRVKKVKGGDYCSKTLMNMLGGYNRLIRRASDLRALRGETRNIVQRDFYIKKHAAFTKTRLTLKAAVQKSAKDGNNKKRTKTLTECHEDCILADIDHQFHNGTGVQKRLVFYLVTRCGVRGGGELYELKRCDLQVKVDSHGRDYVWFEERTSKNNNYGLDRYKEEQFRETYYSYEVDFVFTVKQYLRHLPELAEGVNEDLLLGTISNPIGVVWFNRVHKVSADRCASFLKGMAKLVGIDPDVFSNKSGRATLITRMAARGVPDEAGMKVTGHHTTSGYGRYDRSQHLKREAATLVSCTPGLTYKEAFRRISETFVKEKLIGTNDNLHPLMDPENEKKLKLKQVEQEKERAKVSEPTMSNESVVSSEACSSVPMQGVAIMKHGQEFAAWHKHYDEINWEEELGKNPVLGKMLGGHHVAVQNHVAGHSFSNIHNCQITIQVVHPQPEIDKENKENKPPSIR